MKRWCPRESQHIVHAILRFECSERTRDLCKSDSDIYIQVYTNRRFNVLVCIYGLLPRCDTLRGAAAKDHVNAVGCAHLIASHFFLSNRCLRNSKETRTTNTVNSRSHRGARSPAYMLALCATRCVPGCFALVFVVHTTTKFILIYERSTVGRQVYVQAQLTRFPWWVYAHGCLILLKPSCFLFPALVVRCYLNVVHRPLRGADKKTTTTLSTRIIKEPPSLLLLLLFYYYYRACVSVHLYGQVSR